MNQLKQVDEITKKVITKKIKSEEDVKRAEQRLQRVPEEEKVAQVSDQRA